MKSRLCYLVVVLAIPQICLAASWDIWSWINPQPSDVAPVSVDPAPAITIVPSVTTDPVQELNTDSKSTLPVVMPIESAVGELPVSVAIPTIKKFNKLPHAKVTHTLAVHLDAYRQKQWLWSQWLPKHMLSEGGALWTQMHTHHLRHYDPVNMNHYTGHVHDVSIGYQWLQNKDFLWGLGLSLLEHKLQDHDNVLQHKMMSVQGISFFNLTFDRFYTDFALAIGHNQYHSTMLQSKSQSHSQQYVVVAEFGKTFEIYGAGLSPFVQTQYGFVGANHLNDNREQALSAGMGAKLAYQLYYWSNQLIEARFQYGRDLAFIEGRVIQAELKDKDTLQANMSVSILKHDKPFLMLGYAFMHQAGFHAHGASIKYYYGW